MILPLAMAMIAAGVIVWPESSLENVYPTTLPTSAESIAIAAARGEWESVQVCVRNDTDELVAVALDATAPGNGIPPPTVYVVDFVTLPQSPTRPFGPMRVPDILRAYEPVRLASNSTVAFWLTYRVPVDAEPGTSDGLITVTAGAERRELAIRCEVYGFSLPPVPSLRSLLPLNRSAMTQGLTVPSSALETWAPVYDFLAQFRLSFSLWDDPELAPRKADQTVDVAAMQEHLLYFTEHATASVVDAGFGARGVEPVRGAAGNQFIPETQVFLYEMAHWLRAHELMTRAAIVVPPLPSRLAWQTMRERSFEIFEAEPDLSRVCLAPLHPFFERYSDIWAIPLRDANPYAILRMRDGQSLHVFRPTASPVVTASGSGPSLTERGYETSPNDAFDGSFFSTWVSALESGASFPWIEIALDRQVSTQEIRIGWVPDHEAGNVRVRLSFDGRTYSTADVQWETEVSGDIDQPSWSIGRFTAPKRFSGIRFEFHQETANSPVAIADMLLSRALEQDPAPVNAIQPWLAVQGDAFPSLALPANPGSPRLLPWVCWAHKFLGFVTTGFAAWPDAWQSGELTFPSEWPTGDVLVYPERGGLAPSMRLMRLRDGLEDYEYFRNLEQMTMIFGAQGKDSVRELRQHRVYPATPTHDEVRAFEASLLERRNAMGEQMNNLLRVEN